MLILSIAVAVAIGWLGVHLLLPLRWLRPRWAAWLLEATLGIGTGIGLTSSLFFLLLLCGAGGRGVVISSEIILLLALAGLILVRDNKRPAESHVVRPALGWNWALALAVIVGAVLALACFLDSSRARAFGDWDAWSIWNIRARFLAGPGETWRSALSPLLARTHPDYPLLLSGFVARCWTYLGEATPAAVPIAAALLFSSALAGLLISGLVALRSSAAGLLTGLILLTSTPYLSQAASQYADIPLSFYMLAAFTLLLLGKELVFKSSASLLLAGAYAAFGAWTKNEGLLFVPALVVVVLFVEKRAAGWRAASEKCLRLVLGALPVLLVTLFFKFLLAPATDPLVSQPVSQALEKVAEPGRYVQIAKAFFWQAYSMGSGWTHPFLLLGILAVALRFGIVSKHKSAVIVVGLTLSLVIAGYFGAYLVTPTGLEWHLSTSLGRLYMQIWPSVLLLSFMVLRTPEECAIRQDIKDKLAGGKRKKKRK